MKDGPVGPTRFQIRSIYGDGDDQDIEFPIQRLTIVKSLESIRLGLVPIQDRVWDVVGMG